MNPRHTCGSNPHLCRFLWRTLPAAERRSPNLPGGREAPPPPAAQAAPRAAVAVPCGAGAGRAVGQAAAQSRARPLCARLNPFVHDCVSARPRRVGRACRWLGQACHHVPRGVGVRARVRLLGHCPHASASGSARGAAKSEVRAGRPVTRASALPAGARGPRLTKGPLGARVCGSVTVTPVSGSRVRPWGDPAVSVPSHTRRGCPPSLL